MKADDRLPPRQFYTLRLSWVGSQDFSYILIQAFSIVFLTPKLEKRRAAPAAPAPSNRKYEKWSSRSRSKTAAIFFVDNRKESWYEKV